MRLMTIASGSSGNAGYLGSESTHLLIDAGISRRRIVQGLEVTGLKPGELSGVLLTHEHADHVCGLKVLLKKDAIPLYATAGTLEVIKKKGLLDEYPAERIHVIRGGEAFSLGDLTVLPLSIDHDAAEPVGYRVTNGSKSAAFLTDLGHATEELEKALQGLDTLLLESNHDVRMLEAGPYPYPLKRRILGDCGHLSNESAGRLLATLCHGGLQQVLLGHLSKENNLPELAYETVRCELSLLLGRGEAAELPLAVAARDCCSDIYAF